MILHTPFHTAEQKRIVTFGISIFPFGFFFVVFVMQLALIGSSAHFFSGRKKNSNESNSNVPIGTQLSMKFGC